MYRLVKLHNHTTWNKIGDRTAVSSSRRQQHQQQQQPKDPSTKTTYHF